MVMPMKIGTTSSSVSDGEGPDQVIGLHRARRGGGRPEVERLLGSRSWRGVQRFADDERHGALDRDAGVGVRRIDPAIGGEQLSSVGAGWRGRRAGRPACWARAAAAGSSAAWCRTGSAWLCQDFEQLAEPDHAERRRAAHREQPGDDPAHDAGRCMSAVSCPDARAPGARRRAGRPAAGRVAVHGAAVVVWRRWMRGGEPQRERHAAEQQDGARGPAQPGRCAAGAGALR